MNKRKNLYNLFIDYMLGFLIVFTILSYTENPVGSSILKFIPGFIIILSTIGKIDFNAYKWVGWLFLIVGVMPLILIILGVYNYDTGQSIAYIFLFSYYLVLIICLAEFYSNKLVSFITIWQVSITLVLAGLFVIYRGISLNLSYLLSLTISNQRYGQFLLVQRYGMGFRNVNTLAMVSMLLIFCSVFNLIKSRLKALSIIDIAASIIVILNAESRTPFILMFVLLICYLISRVKNNARRIFVENLVFIFEVIIAICFTFIFVNDSQSSFYNAIDEISSYRLSFGASAFILLKNIGNIFLGLGPLNSSYITKTIFGNTLTLDNSIEYYVFTLGLLGFALVYIYLFYLFFIVNKSGSKFGFITTTFYFVYSFFENTIFLPISTISLLCLTIIFITVRNSEENGTAKINYNSHYYL